MTVRTEVVLREPPATLVTVVSGTGPICPPASRCLASVRLWGGGAASAIPPAAVPTGQTHLFSKAGL